MAKLKTKEDVSTHWTNVAKKVLQGKTIVEVRYLNDEEMEMMGWYKRPVCFSSMMGLVASCRAMKRATMVVFYFITRMAYYLSFKIH